MICMCVMCCIYVVKFITMYVRILCRLRVSVTYASYVSMSCVYVCMLCYVCTYVCFVCAHVCVLCMHDILCMYVALCRLRYGMLCLCVYYVMYVFDVRRSTYYACVMCVYVRCGRYLCILCMYVCTYV